MTAPTIPKAGDIAPEHPRSRWTLVVGDTEVARRVCTALDSADHPVLHLGEPDDDALAQALQVRASAVAVLVRDDVRALRYALAIAHLDPTVRLVVTIFDRTIAGRVRELLPQALVTSAAELAAPSVAGPCLGHDVIAAWRDGDSRYVLTRGPEPDVEPLPPTRKRARVLRFLAQLLIPVRSHETHTKLLLLGLAGLVGVLVADWTWLVLGAHTEPTVALLDAARVVATVGPAEHHASTAYTLFAATAMLATVVLTAVFTAGVVDRLLQPPLLGLFGPRRVPRSGHVVVVGIGQVGLRLCAELRSLGVPVVGVERDASAPYLRIAQALKIPVVHGHGDDRKLLEDLRVSKANALAAVGSDELDNIAVAIASNAVSPGTSIVLRAGEQEAIAETRSLLPLGVTRDVLHICVTWVFCAIVDDAPDRLVVDGSVLYAVRGTEVRLVRTPTALRAECDHVPAAPLTLVP